MGAIALARDRRRVARAAGRDADSGTAPVAETGNNPQDGVLALSHDDLVACGFGHRQKEKAIVGLHTVAPQVFAIDNPLRTSARVPSLMCSGD